MNRRLVTELTGLLILVGYVVLVTVYGRFIGLDEIASKAAGREWGLHGRWAAPELTGWLPPTVPPVEQVYGMYPPLYPLIFGLFVKLAGFGWRQCVFYDAAIHAVLAYLVAWVVRTLGGGRIPVGWEWLAAVAILPLGTAGESRPDEMAICFGMGGLLILMGPSIGFAQALLCGLCFGLTAGTSLGAAAMLASIALGFLLAAESTWLQRAKLTTLCGMTALFLFFLIIAPTLIPYPGLIDQFTANSRTTLRLNQSFVQRILETLLPLLGFYRNIVVSVVVPGLVALLLSIWNRCRNDRRTLIRYWAGTLGAIAFWMATTCKLLYLWFIGPWLIALAVTELATAWLSLRWVPRLILAVVLGAACVLGSELTIRESLLIATLSPTQRQGWNQQLLSKLIPPGSVVLTADAWWFLAGDRTVYDLSFSRPDMERVDFVVLSGDGSVVSGLPKIRNFVGFEEYPLLEKFRPVSDNLNRSRQMLLGRPLARNTNGFGCLVLERISRESPSDH